MKKALALILALIMLCSSVAVITAYAADDVAINIEEMPGYSKSYIGKPIETPPVQDGAIGTGEYTFVRNVKYLPGNKYATDTNVEITEAFAYDANFIYYAYYHPLAYKFSTMLIVRLEPDYVIDATPTPFGAHTTFVDPNHALRLQMNTTYNKTPYQASKPAWAEYPTADQFAFGYTRTANDSTYAPLTVEFKISRAYLATQMGLDDASDVTKFMYSFYGNDSALENPYVTSWGYPSCDHLLTDDQKAWLKAAGVTTPLGNTTDGTTLSRLYNMVVLDEAPSTYWADFAEGQGLNIHVPYVTTAPVLDGEIGFEEYPISRTTPLSGLSAGDGSGHLAGENVVEYYAHDANYIYYAAVFTRPSINKAFWPRFKLENSFDIFNSNYAKHAYIDYRISGTPHTYCNQQAGYGTYAAPVDGQDVFCEGKRVGEVETFELKIAKSYIANANGITNADVKVLPYYSYFHASTAVGNILNRYQITSIGKAGGVAPGANRSLIYTFMVFDEAPETDWESVTEEAGLNIHVKPVTTAPILDGVVKENEYPTSRTTPISGLSAGDGNGHLAGTEVVEYYGHDAEYIYYAAVFTRPSINKAFWPRFKLENSFDIFNSNYAKHAYIDYRISGTPHTYCNQQAGYGTYAAPVDGQDVFCEGKRVGEVETFELKIAKSYIANANGITNADVKVLPYYSYFHASTAVGSIITEKQAEAITAAGGTAPAVTSLGYTFMVLDGEYEDLHKIEDRFTVTTYDKASIRLSPTNSGLRFKSEVSTADLQTLMSKYAYVKVGTLIAPENYGLDLSTVIDNDSLVEGKNYINVEADINTPIGHDKNITVFAGSITNFKGNNAGRNFEALGYIAYSADGVNWTYVYAGKAHITSAAWVAQEAIARGDYANDQAALDILEAYAAVKYEA